MQVHIRQATPADRDQLARLREALWPDTSAVQHARELEPILAGNTPGAMPLINFVAQAEDGTLAGFAEVDLRSHADGCNPERPVGYLEGAAASAAVSSLLRKTGLEATAASRWHPTRGSTTMYRNVVTKPWGSKS